MEYESLYQSLQQQCLECKVVRQLTTNEFEACAVFKFSAEFVGFDGHFPGQPLLPAIVQIAAARYVAERVLQKPLYPESYSRTKFKGIILPEETIELHLHLKNEDNKWVGKFSLQKQGIVELEIVANGNCTFIQVSKKSDQK